MATQIQLRRDTSSNWTANNPTLAAGEFAWESDTNRFKIGDGTTAWTSLGYASDGDTAGITFVGDDSTGTLVAQNETFKIAGTQNITTAVAGDTVTITGPDLTAYSTFSGSYTDLTDKPTIPTNNNELTNGAGYITDYTVTEGDVTQHQSALAITESQITDLGSYITASSTDTLTNKSGNISQFTNDAGYKTSVSEADVTQHQAALSITESQISDLTHFSGSYTDLTNKPTIPSAVSELSNDTGFITNSTTTMVGDDSTGTTINSGETFKIAGTQNISTAVAGDTLTITGPDLTSYATTSYVDTEVAGLVDTAPEALNTLNELAAALGDDENFATTTSTALGNRLRVDTDAQGLSTEQKTNAKTNLGLSTVASTGAYSDLSGTPTIPSNNNELTNGAGYITGYTVTEADVTQHQSALSITESQISDLTHFSGSYTDLTNKPTIPTNNTELANGAGYITASSTDTLTNKSGNVSQFTNDSGYKTAVSESDVTQHQAALSITESQITDLTHFSGSYTDLTNKPTIPTNNTELTNGAGYITASSTDTLTNKSGAISQWTNDTGYKTAVSQSDVTQHQAALSITESQISDLTHFSGSYTDLTNKPTIPTNNTELANGAGYITASSLTGLASESYVNTQIANTVDSAPETLNTLNELAAALGDDANFATTTSTALGNRLRVDTAAQGLTTEQKSNAKTNLGLATVASTGAYSDLSGTPTIPTNNNQLTNGAGYITDYTVTEGDVTAHQAALSITESQITDLGSYITASSTDTLTNKSGAISQWTNDSGYSTFSGSYADLTNKPTIPTNNTELTNGAGYITGVSFADVTGKPTTTAGYGITDAFSGSYTDLTNKPTLFSGSYTDLTNKPTIPSALTDLSISDGTSGQVLTTDGAGGFTFTTVSGGGTSLPSQTGESGKYLTTDGTNLSWATVSGGAASTGDYIFTGNTMSTGSSNADMELTTSGTGKILLKPLGGDYNTYKSRYDNPSYYTGNILYYENLADTAGTREYGNTLITNIKTDGADSSASNARYRNYFGMSLDLNGANLTSSSTYISRGAQNTFESMVYNSAAGGDDASVANHAGIQVNPSAGIQSGNPTSALTVTSMAGVSTTNDFIAGTDAGGTLTVPNSYNFYGNGWGIDGNTASNIDVQNHYGVYLRYGVDTNNSDRNPTNIYSFVADYDKARAKPGALEKFNEYAYEATHSSGAGYTLDFNNGNLQAVTLTSNITSFTMSNFPTDSKHSVGVTLYLIQDGTGSRTMTFSAGSGETFKFSNGANSSSVSAANDIQVCYIFSRYNGTSNTFYWTIGPAYS
jgi:hypothetical protein